MLRLVALCVWGIATATASLPEPVAAAAFAHRPGAESPAPQAEVRRTGAKVFSHLAHVPGAWNQGAPEVWRDCRGCHRFAADQPVSAPQQQCASCHIGAGALQPEFAADWQQDLSGYRGRSREAFRHHTHGMLECRECHQPKDNDFGSENYQILTGPGHCARCHEAGRVTAETVVGLRWFQGAQGDAAKALGLAKFERPTDAADHAKKLVAALAGASGGLNTTPLPSGGDFRHGDHFGIGCADCHRNVKQAAADGLGTGEIPTTACGSCHYADAAKTPSRPLPGTRKVDRPLQSLAAFAHRDHFRFQQSSRRDGICTPDAYAAVESGCQACHTYAPTEGRDACDFPFAGGKSKHTYLDCVGCHDVDGWRTGETKAAPRHESTGGSAAGWTDCARCHVFGQPDLAKVRPEQQVRRFTERTFEFAAHAHPDITQKGIAQAQAAGRPLLADCRDCHRATVPELSSRRSQKPFRHDVHLAAEPTSADCLQCHPRAANATDAAALATDFRTYDLAVCSKCHFGSPVVETTVVEREPAARAVVAFPHGPHATAAKLACAECHAPTADGRDIATKPQALACNECHDHKEGGSKAEGLFGPAVQSCARCHHDADPAAGARAVASVPPIGVRKDPQAFARYQVAQESFGGFADAQFHPLGVGCAECHKERLADDGKTLPAISLPIGDHLFAQQPGSVHGTGPKEPAACLRCHWKAAEGWRPSVDSSVADEADKRFRRQPESKETRAAFGNESNGYPGRPESKG